MKRLFLSLALLFSAAFLHAADGGYSFNHYQTRDGLTSNTVYCTMQDGNGFIWIGTDDGICVYDGYRFIYWGTVDPDTMMRGMSTAVCVDADGLVWFSTVAGCGFFNPVTNETVNIGIHERVPASTIVVDAEGCVWFQFQTLYKYDKKEELLSHYSEVEYFRVSSLTTDSYGTPWCTSEDGDMYRYEPRTDRFRKEWPGDLRMVKGLSSGRLLLVGKSEEVWLVDPENFQRDRIFSCSETGGRHVLCLMERCAGEYWISTETGIWIYREGEGLTAHLTRSDADPKSLSSNYITNLFADAEGNVWAGTNYRGLNVWLNSHDAYTFYYPDGREGSMHGHIVRAIEPDPSGAIWMGTEDGALNRFDPETKTFDYFDFSGIYNNIQDLLVQGDELWIATFGNGLYRYNPALRRLNAHVNVGDNGLTCLLRSSGGALLAGAGNGLYRYDEGTDRFVFVPVVEDNLVQCMREDSLGRIWVGTEGSGIFILDGELNLIRHLQPELDLPGAGRITSFFEDGWNRMWVTTGGAGILVTYLSSDEFRFQMFTRANGLPSNNTCSVTEDDNGMLWVSTNRGLFMMHPDTFQLTSFFDDTQMVGNQYSYDASYLSPDGTIYLGTTDGVFVFDPDALMDLHRNNEVYILDINGLAGDRRTRLIASGATAHYTERVRVSYKDVTVLQIAFSAPNYSNVLATRYETSFTSKNMDIRSVSTENVVQYSNIGYGKHVFTVGIYGSDDPASTRSLEVIVTPPFWKSVYAKVLWGLLLVAIWWMGALLTRRVRKVKRDRQEEALEQMKQRELYESKNSFFTNITHEIRTPLTLIKMPLDKIIRLKEYAPVAEKDMLVIQANTNRLLSLTNQLLDLKKLENGDEKLEFTRQNICDTVRETCDRFAPMAVEQEVHLTVNVPDEVIDMMYAVDSVVKILSNLLSNAMKYGQGLIDVSLELVDGKKVVIRVDSNGWPIPEAERERIFEKFYHGGKGTGLGLPLARTLAELHGGRLYLDPNRTDRNSFVLELPIDHPEQVEVKRPTQAVEAKEFSEYDSTRSSLLIVEDNQEFRLYLAKEFNEEYNVFLAANGKAAIEVLETQRIDLVISDIMMPVMDGCELCNEIKSNPEYSHIPVILLTAAVGTETRIETLQVGADGYIEKPFPIELLRANIANLFKNKEIAYRQFTSSPLSHFSSAASKVDEAFMDRLHKIIQDNMTDNNLGLDELASQMNTSNSTLYRKVKANTGMNVNEYVRLCRLKRAAELLASQQYRINEVADMLGFSSSSYFAASFQKQFNISPSAFVKNLKR